MLIYSELLTLTEGDFPVSLILWVLYSTQLNKDPEIRYPQDLLYVQTVTLLVIFRDLCKTPAQPPKSLLEICYSPISDQFKSGSIKAS